MATPEMQIYLANMYCLPAGAEGRGLAGGSWRRREAKTSAMLSPPPRLSCCCLIVSENPLSEVCSDLTASLWPLLKCPYPRERVLVRA